MSNKITIKLKERQIEIAEGKPAIVVWKSKNKERKGIATAICWVKRGEHPKTLQLIHSCFQTWDKVESEYPCSWNVWESQILNIKPLKGVKND